MISATSNSQNILLIACNDVEGQHDIDTFGMTLKHLEFSTMKITLGRSKLKYGQIL